MVGWKFTKFLMSYLKLQVTFSLNFASLFSVIYSSALLSWNLYDLDKSTHQSAKFQKFDCWREISPNLYFDRLLLLKVYKISAKKVQRNYVSWHWQLCKIWRKTDFLFQKWQEFGEFWSEHSKVSKICTLMGSFWPRYMMLELKKYRGVIFYGTQEWFKIWRKTDFWFEKWHEEFSEFLPEHLNVY